MTIYACSSVAGFVPPGGVCEGHSLTDPPADPEYHGLSVDCPICEPILAKDRLWATDAGSVPLTRAEEQAIERGRLNAERAALENALADQQFLRAQRAAR